MNSTFQIKDSDIPAAYEQGALEVEHDGKTYILQYCLPAIRHGSITGEFRGKELLIYHPEGTRYNAVEKEGLELRVQKLRSMRHAYAPKVASLSKIIQMAAKALVKIEKDMDRQANEIDGEYYKSRYTLSFEIHGSNDAQVDLDGFVTTPDFQSILKTATETAEAAEDVASFTEPPPLPSESFDCE